uniref:uncharacterized protein LOC125389930 isoform X2 n=1 Tax=Myodes glareolus TaxID=447135 RepID=UPI002021FBC4|nr:uncharacterized protein LOC125389930 isoform X2 [Myodes glareolus]
MLSCFRKTRGSGHRKGKGGLLGHLWGLLTHVWSSCTGQDQAQEDFDRLCRPLKFDYRSPYFIDKVVSYLPTALRKGKYDFVDAFLAVYPAFATTLKVLVLITDKIMYGCPHAGFPRHYIRKRCGSLHDDFLEHYIIKRNILYFLIHWMQKMPEDFSTALDRMILKRLLDYLYQYFPQVFHRLRVQTLVSQLGVQKSAETPEEDEEARDRGFRRATTSLAPIPDATEMQEKKLHPSPPSVAGPPGDLTPKEDTESADSATGGPTLPEDAPEQLKRTSADSVHVIIPIQTAEHIPAVVPVVPLPDDDV